nr:MAG TPA: hypothetical protein [Caudoviricetes sp.]
MLFPSYYLTSFLIIIYHTLNKSSISKTIKVK